MGIFAPAYQHNVSVDGDESRPDVNESPDLLEVYVPTAGIVQAQLVLPNTIALAGVVLHQQVVPIELSGTGSITALTGTNALTLTIGSS